MCNTFFAAPFIGLIPAMPQLVFDAGANATAAPVRAQGVGAVAMALSLGPLATHFPSRRVLLFVLWGLPPALVVYALMPTLLLACLAVAVVGFLYLGAVSSFTSISQLRAPAAVRGRVLSLLIVILGVLYPVGLAIQGPLAHAVGLRETTVAAASRMLAVLLVARAVRPRFADALDALPAAFHGEAAGAVEAP